MRTALLHFLGHSTLRGVWKYPRKGSAGSAPSSSSGTWDRNLSPSAVTAGEARQEGTQGTAPTTPESSQAPLAPALAAPSSLTECSEVKQEFIPEPWSTAARGGHSEPLKAVGSSSLCSGTLHDAGNPRELGVEHSRDLPKGGASPEPAAAPWEGSHTRRDLDTASVFAWDFQEHK